MTPSNWNATAFFKQLAETNLLAIQHRFTFCEVSGLDGFEDALSHMQTSVAFVCVSDIAQGYTALDNTPHTRRVKTVFFAMRHPIDNMQARAQCFDTMRELFRQFMSVLLLEQTKLQQSCIYLDPRIQFNEIDRYFFSGCACAYFQVATDIYTDLRYATSEWLQPESEPEPEPEPIIFTHNFSGNISSDYFTVSGKTSPSYGSVEVDGRTYSLCLKMETNTSISFGIESSGELLLLFNQSDGATILIDGVSYTIANGSVTAQLAAGTHTIRKANKSSYLFYIKVTL